MNYDQFCETYQPIENPFDENAGFNGTLFETYGDEYNHVLKTHSNNKNKVATIIESDSEKMYVISGMHVVNRFGYFILAVHFEDEFEFCLDD
jgi:hypothetical protein